MLVSHAKGKGFLKYFPLPNNVVEFIKDLEKYDAVIQVGGSFFVDLYGTGQFEHILCSNIAGKPIYLVGHSVGPFENPKFQHIAKYCFTKAEKIILREDVSLSLMEKDNFNLNNVTLGVDTAFLVDTEKDVNDYAVSHWKKIIKEQKTVALTVRKLA
ncbi:colanic acid biosynthesis pyruvyl transferase WcaK, partial [Klebsiella pneumoniae]|nr:colanic acid biosynthesis pyruvyl transferase WcaK [Klebsiella pneumoniae]